MARGQSKQALDDFRREQARYKQPPVGVPPSKQAAQTSSVWTTYGQNRWQNADSYYAARQRSINRLPEPQAQYYTHPPIWVQNSRPSYHGVSGAFLGAALGFGAGMLLEDGYARWMYAHRQDDSYREWRADMDRQATENADLRARLAALDAKMHEMEEAKTPVNKAALPEGVDPSMVVAPDVVLLATSQDESTPWGEYVTILFVVGGIGGLLYYLAVRRRRPSFT